MGAPFKTVKMNVTELKVKVTSFAHRAITISGFIGSDIYPRKIFYIDYILDSRTWTTAPHIHDEFHLYQLCKACGIDIDEKCQFANPQDELMFLMKYLERSTCL